MLISTVDSIADKQVPVIDLTMNEDGDCDSELNGKRSSSLIELNVESLPLDVNGNEILITTNTKTMQAIAYKKKKKKSKDTNEFNSSLRQAKHLSDTICAENLIQCSQQAHCSIRQQSNRTQNANFRKPPKEQTEFDNKYNRWLRYLRSYNGFRLFAQRYYRKAQAYSHAHTHFRLQQPQNAGETRLFIESILLKWWNLLNANEQEQYVQIADMQKCQPAKDETTNETLVS